MDITGIYISLNKLPQYWVDYHLEVLKDAAPGMPIISITKKPMDLGMNLLDTDEPGYTNIYRQLLRAAKLATTKYVAMIEDDCLYSKSHFFKFRPQDDEFAYNRNRWSLFSWGEPIYSLRQRLSNCSLIAPRDLLIEALQERFDKYNGHPPDSEMGECGRARIEDRLKVTRRKQVDFLSRVSIVHINHPLGTEDRQQQQWKSHAEIRAYDIPHWGKAADIVNFFNNGINQMEALK
ncbi:hypothetical protein KW791_00595 [Candidatus Parcubacteria bacterium]|nr:hypothetical protein [Candidatus Parcubacteria bacterium]